MTSSLDPRIHGPRPGAAAGENAAGEAADLALLEELHRAMLGSSPDTVFLLDDRGAFKFVYPNVSAIFGHSAEEVIALGRVDQLLGPMTFDAKALAELGASYSRERKIVAKSGEQRTVIAQFQRIATNTDLVICTCRDVTDLRRMEGELATTHHSLAEAARLAQTGKLLNSILHEIRHPLLAIRYSAASGRRDAANLAAGHPLHAVLENIESATEIASGIIDRLLNLSTGKPGERRPVDVAQTIDGLLRVIAVEADFRRVMLRSELAPGLPKIVGDRVGLQQLVMDLVVNGIEAAELEDGGRFVTVRAWSDGESIEIAVGDSGAGVAAAERDRLFDPFFTTKEGGLGLGLPIARSIAAAHGGRLWLDEDGGAETTFRVSLPTRARLKARGAASAPVESVLTEAPRP